MNIMHKVVGTFFLNLMVSFKQKKAGNISSVLGSVFFFFLEVFFWTASTNPCLTQVMDTWKSPSVFGKGLCIARSDIFRSYNEAEHCHYFTEILPVTSDTKSNTKAAAATLLSFLLVKVILALTDSENRELNFTLTL